MEPSLSANSSSSSWWFKLHPDASKKISKLGGKMNLTQMSNYIKKHRKKTEFGCKHDLKKGCEDDFVNTNKMMCIRIFGGKLEITCEQFLEFRNKLQEMIWHYEFFQFTENKK